jgi:hypothetical protein
MTGGGGGGTSLLDESDTGGGGGGGGAGSSYIDTSVTDATSASFDGFDGYISVIYNACAATVTVTTDGGSTTPTGTVGSPFSQCLTASGGTAPYTWAVTTGTPPAGVTLLDVNDVECLTGTPTTSGSSTFTVTATDSNSVEGTLQLTATIDPVGTTTTTTAAVTTTTPASSGGSGATLAFTGYNLVQLVMAGFALSAGGMLLLGALPVVRLRRATPTT